jgi:phosphoglycolate phosphatase-like HAD superfamily hydrolase
MPKFQGSVFDVDGVLVDSPHGKPASGADLVVTTLDDVDTDDPQGCGTCRCHKLDRPIRAGVDAARRGPRSSAGIVRSVS